MSLTTELLILAGIILGSRQEINRQRLRRILVPLIGAPKGAYQVCMTFGTTPKTG